MKKIICFLRNTILSYGSRAWNVGLFCIMLTGMLIVFTSCKGIDDTSNISITENPSPAEIPESPASPEKLICGVTMLEPMNYIENGEWTGFDTEFAKLVGEKLGMEVEFKLINWDRKYAELNSGTINAIWNGFTATANEKGMKRTSLCDMSYSYMLKTQCVVVKTERLPEFSSEKDMAGTALAAESGSSGEKYATELVAQSGKVISVAAKSDALSEVIAGTVDGAVVDLTLAKQLSDNEDYPGLSIAFELYPEVYAIGFRKGDSLRDKVNKAIKELYNEGKLYEIAKKYGIEDNLVLDTTFGQEDCDC